MKKILIALALCMGMQTQADAQLLKNIGNAVKKGVTKLNQAAKSVDQAVGGQQNQNSETTTSTKKKNITQTFQSGATTIRTEGNMRGVEVSWIGAFRTYGSNSVSVRYRNFNNSDQRINVSIGEANGNTPTCAIDGQGHRYGCDVIYMGGSGMAFDNQCKMEAGTRDLVALRFDNVSTSVSSFETVVVGGSVDNEDEWNYVTLTASNIPIAILPAITAKGVFGEQKVLTGQALANLPKTFPYLYDAYTVSKEDDEGETITLVTFTLKGQETMTAVSYDNKTIANITVTSPDVKALVKDTYFGCGMEYNKLKYSNGVEVDSDYGRASYQGIFFDENEQGKICSISI